MKKPSVFVQVRKDLVHSVKVVDESSLPLNQKKKQEQMTGPLPVGIESADEQRRDYARLRKATMLDSPIPSAISHGWSAEESLNVLDRDDCPLPKFIPPVGKNVSGIKVPKRLPRDSSFLLTVEWPLRPGDSRIEAYFIGTNKKSKYWFLVMCTIDDLSPDSTKYLETRTTALIEKKRLEIEEAAILLLRCVWQYEKNYWETERFFMVTEDGLIDTDTASEIADLVWPDEEAEGHQYEPEVIEIEEEKEEEEEEEEKLEPIVACGSGYILRVRSIKFHDGITMKEFAEAFSFFESSPPQWGDGLFCINIDNGCDGLGYRFITYQIKARLGKYLKSWEGYELGFGSGKPLYPDWLESEFDPESHCHHIYGVW